MDSLHFRVEMSISDILSLQELSCNKKTSAIPTSDKATGLANTH